MYKKVSTDLDFQKREIEIIEFWRKNEIFKKSLSLNEDGEKFTFYDGPPTANGKPHIGHVITRAVKDLVTRYKFMKGYNVLRKAGWDTHGLPVELEVEKNLGMDGKGDIEKFGVEPFIEECKKSVWKYTAEWEKMSERVAYWVDMKDPYVTYHNNYIESVWWSLKKIFDKGLLYKGHKVVPYCPRCGTALSSHEVAQGYKDVKEKSIFVRFKLLNDDASILAWTTTPWTLPSNVALCVNPKEEYVKVKANGEFLILAKALVENVFNNSDSSIETVKSFKGKELERLQYRPLFQTTADKPCHYVVCDEFVTLTDGSGVVHIAPAFGEDDAEVGRKYELPFVQAVDESGRFKDGVDAELTGLFVKDADKLIISKLKERGLVFRVQEYEHSYPFCWRCDTPLLYYARESWFIKMTAVRDMLLKNNAGINWIPPSIGSGRMGNFIENVVDWGISRERYWGTPLPLWVCACGHVHAVGSIAELGVSGGIELHKPYVDKIKLKCEKCGGEMTRTPEVIDCWYDSGSMPFAQWHYPFENKDIFKTRFPADFISEAVDQTRGWFYTLLAISTLIFDEPSFKNCIVLGHVGDKDGKKMSKHLGNVVDPWTVLDKQGADAVRWYFYSSSAPWLPSRFSVENVSEVQRKFMGTLWNTYAFYILYAEIDKFNPTEHVLSKCKLSLLDKWALSGLNTLIKNVDEYLGAYKTTEAARAIDEYVFEISNWYVRRSRERFWGGGMTDDKISAYMTLYTILDCTARLSAPFTPFMAESIYQNITRSVDKNAPESVHFTSFPAFDVKYRDDVLETDMRFVLDAVNLGRGARAKANIKNRQPLSVLYIATERKVSDKTIFELIKDEINVKDVKIVTDGRQFVGYSLKPQLKTLGKKYGKLLNEIREHLTNSDSKKIVFAVANGKSYKFKAGADIIELFEEDILIENADKAGFSVENGFRMTVALKTELSEELLLEGTAREIVSKLQNMRKESGFEVTDRINLTFFATGRAETVLKGDYGIKEDVLADRVSEGKVGKEIDINGEKVFFSIERVKP